MTRALRWLGGLAVLTFLLLWLAPLLIDGNRFREPIARIASAAAGRPVIIAGAVGVEILPEPMLTATDVTIPDQGDGIALSVRALRLRIGLAALLTGRVEARELVLREPELDLPWPLAPGALTRRLPVWITGFSARVEAGTLRVGGPAGGFTIARLDGTVGTDPDTGALTAQGDASAVARQWHFTARLGRPGGDGIASIDLTADGAGAAQDTGGRLSGRVLADGSVVGDLSARGPDLGALLPAPAVAWQAEGRVAAAAGLATANDLSLVIGGSPAHGSVSLLVGASPRLDLALSAGRLDLDAWLPALLRGGTALPTGIDLAAQSATLAGGTLRSLRGQFAIAGAAIEVKDAEAVLPGETGLQLRGTITRGADGPHFAGTTTLTATDLRATLSWLRPFAKSMPPPLLADLLAAAPRQAELAGSLSLSPDAIGIDSMTGRVQGVPVGLHADLALGAMRHLSAALTTERADVTPLLPALREIARGGTPGLPVSLSCAAGLVVAGPVTLRSVALEAKSDGGGLTVTRLQAGLGDAALMGSGALRADGSVRLAKLSLTAPDAASVYRLLPPGWGGPPGIWHGAFEVKATLEGPADGLGLTASLAIGDLRIDAAPVISASGASWSGPVTLRHPGMRRLAREAGLGDAGWLGEGSVALVTALNATPHLVSLDDIEVNAGSLRASGNLAVTDPFGVDGVGLTLAGRFAAATLPLPASLPWNEPLPLSWLRRLDASVAVSAADVQANGQSVAADADLRVLAGDGAIRVDVAGARVAGGVLSGHAGLVLPDPDEGAIAGTGGPAGSLAGSLPGARMEFALKGAQVMRPLLGLPIDVTGGMLDLGFAGEARGHSPAALAATLSGRITATLRDGTMTGFDLARAAAALRSNDADTLRTGLRDALDSGATRFSRADVMADMASGVATLGQALVDAPDGSVRIAGTIDPMARIEDLRLVLQALPAGAPAVGLRVTGTQRSVEIADALLWLAKKP